MMATVVLKLLSTKMCQTCVPSRAQMLRPRLLAWVVTLNYSADQRQKEQQQLLQGMLHKKKEQFKENRQILLQDIKEARDKVKEKMEEVIEASQNCCEVQRPSSVSDYKSTCLMPTVLCSVWLWNCFCKSDASQSNFLAVKDIHR